MSLATKMHESQKLFRFSKKSEERNQEFEEEIGDILYTLACFANTQDINLDEALQKSLDKVQERDKDRF